MLRHRPYTNPHTFSVGTTRGGFFWSIMFILQASFNTELTSNALTSTTEALIKLRTSAGRKCVCAPAPSFAGLAQTPTFESTSVTTSVVSVAILPHLLKRGQKQPSLKADLLVVHREMQWCVCFIFIHGACPGLLCAGFSRCVLWASHPRTISCMK